VIDDARTRQTFMSGRTIHRQICVTTAVTRMNAQLVEPVLCGAAFGPCVTGWRGCEPRAVVKMIARRVMQDAMRKYAEHVERCTKGAHEADQQVSGAEV
jgi:hypothetical protein